MSLDSTNEYKPGVFIHFVSSIIRNIEQMTNLPFVVAVVWITWYKYNIL